MRDEQTSAGRHGLRPAVALTDLLQEARRIDQAVYAAVADASTPALDVPIARLSAAANYSRLWLGVALALSLTGGRRGRRAAAHGLVAVGITSAAANLGGKLVFRRARPRRDDNPSHGAVPMPGSSSFPSGHTASAFAFAMGATAEIPALALPLVPLASAVGYSRVHTGVHYPGDVLAGAALGLVVGSTVPLLSRR